MTKKQRALKIIEKLKQEYPQAACSLDYDQAWKLLVSVRLAAQCTDARVNVVVEKLYEKFPDVNALAEAPVAEIEKHHEERYRALLKNVEAMEVFKKSGVTMWECRNCGHVVVGLEAPEVCPVCNHPQAYFEVRKENY